MIFRKNKEKLTEEIINFLEYLKKTNNDPKKREDKNLIKKFGEKKFKNIESICFDYKYSGREVVRNGNSKNFIIHLTNNGLKYLEELEREERKIRISWGMLISTAMLVLITFLALITTIYFSNNSLKTQIDLANEQIEFLKQTSSTNWAKVEIAFGESWRQGLIFDAKELSKPQNRIEDRKGISLTLVNSGKINTGVIRLEYSEDKYFGTTLYSKEEKEIKVESQSGKEVFIKIIQDWCSIGGEENCDYSQLPHGEYSLNLTFSCQFCHPENRIINQTVQLCIYHNISEQNDCNKQ